MTAIRRYSRLAGLLLFAATCIESGAATAAEAPFTLAPLADRPYAAGAIAAAGAPLFFPSGSTAGANAPADVKAQALLAITHLKESLTAAGLSLADVAFARAFIAPGADGRIDFAGWDAAWAETFASGSKPARSTVGIPFLGAASTLIEVEFVAIPGTIPTPFRAQAGRLTAGNERLALYGTPEGRIAGGVGVKPGTSLYFTAGTLAPTLDTSLPVTDRAHKGDMATQARGTLKRLQENLASVGLTFKDVLYLRAFLAPDVHLDGRYDYDGWNAAYAEFFNNARLPQKPARTTVTTPGFGDPATLIEIEMVAAFPSAPAVFDATSKTPQLKIYGTAASPIASGISIRADASLYFSSGAVAAGDSVEAQAVAALETLKSRMATQGVGLEDVVFLRAYVVPGADGTIDRAGWSAAYSRYFNSAQQPNKPARTTIAVTALPRPEMKIEIDVIAARKP
jgi:enamine deaminase RidA (YjgF/YER057c/UK114 family)